MNLPLDLAKAAPIRAQGLHTLLVLVVGMEFQGTGDRVGGNGGFGTWIGIGMSAVTLELPGVDEGRAPAEQMGFTVVEGPAEETPEI
jgi:hypothetical protein